MNWKHLNDLKGRNSMASLIYGVNSISDNFFIDKNGVIIARNLSADALGETLSDLILHRD
ncbi:hypothetical protein [Patiriisocius sp. Uisw_017]|uniref:hypothetical protein n=1 Tax=Patiriisocius sp. Uisw_017 TaxID=3230968 RepID=UPI0039E74371